MISRLVEQLLSTFEEQNINHYHRNVFMSIIDKYHKSAIAPIVAKEIDSLKNRRA